MIATDNRSRGVLDWSQIDTVLLDMDGTLLDLSFDNFFWQELVPLRYGQAHGLTLSAARAELAPRFAAMRGTLQWYCTDFWSAELQLDIAALKHAARERVAWLPGARQFLDRLARMGKRRYLVTNAHPDSLRVKAEQTGLQAHLDACLSTHSFGYPKEDKRFWPALQREYPFAIERTLFVDDSVSVLCAARDYGIAHIVRILHPDTTQTPQACAEFLAVHGVHEL